MTKGNLLELDSECGHLAPWCETEKLSQAISHFLAE
jgi:hypothetical protein